MGLTEEQRLRMEENKRKAIAKRQQSQTASKQPTNSTSTALTTSNVGQNRPTSLPNVGPNRPTSLPNVGQNRPTSAIPKPSSTSSIPSMTAVSGQLKFKTNRKSSS